MQILSSVKENYWGIFDFNELKQLVYKTDENGIITTYKYDTAGNITAIIDGLGNRVINSYDNRNNLLRSTNQNVETIYGYGPQGLILSYSNGAYKIYHYDYRGSVAAITDINGNITDTIDYDAYGSVAKHTGTTQITIGYNGREEITFTVRQPDRIVPAFVRISASQYDIPAGFVWLIV